MDPDRLKELPDQSGTVAGSTGRLSYANTIVATGRESSWSHGDAIRVGSAHGLPANNYRGAL